MCQKHFKMYEVQSHPSYFASYRTHIDRNIGSKGFIFHHSLSEKKTIPLKGTNRTFSFLMLESTEKPDIYTTPISLHMCLGVVTQGTRAQ